MRTYGIIIGVFILKNGGKDGQEGGDWAKEEISMQW